MFSIMKITKPQHSFKYNILNYPQPYSVSQ